MRDATRRAPRPYQPEQIQLMPMPQTDTPRPDPRRLASLARLAIAFALAAEQRDGVANEQ